MPQDIEDWDQAERLARALHPECWKLPDFQTWCRDQYWTYLIARSSPNLAPFEIILVPPMPVSWRVFVPDRPAITKTHCARCGGLLRLMILEKARSLRAGLRTCACDRPIEDTPHDATMGARR